AERVLAARQLPRLAIRDTRDPEVRYPLVVLAVDLALYPDDVPAVRGDGETAGRLVVQDVVHRPAGLGLGGQRNQDGQGENGGGAPQVQCRHWRTLRSVGESSEPV